MPGNNFHWVAPLPVDASGDAMQEFPSPKTAERRTTGGPSTSSIISFTDNTTSLEIATVGAGASAFRWVATSDTTASVIATGATANYDHIVPANAVRRFALPRETAGVGNSVVGIRVSKGLYARMAVITFGNAPVPSVFVTEH